LDVAAADHLVEQLENECGGSVSFVLEQRTNPLPLLIDGREPGGGGAFDRAASAVQSEGLFASVARLKAFATIVDSRSD
jgi:hypothetical protein